MDTITCANEVETAEVETVATVKKDNFHKYLDFIKAQIDAHQEEQNVCFHWRNATDEEKTDGIHRIQAAQEACAKIVRELAGLNW